MLYIIEYIQLIAANISFQRPELAIQLRNYTGFSVVRCDLPPQDAGVNLLKELNSAGDQAKKNLTIEVSRQGDRLHIDVATDHDVSFSMSCSKHIYWEQMISKQNGRSLQVFVASDDPSVQNLVAEFGASQNMQTTLASLSTKPIKNNTYDIVLIDERAKKHVPKNLVNYVPIISCQTLAKQPECNNALLWPFFDTDLEDVIRRHRMQTPISILVADDSLPSLIATQVILERMGCIVTTATDGRQALAHAKKTSFDILLLDERMPNMKGSEVATELTNIDSPNKSTVKIALTGVNDPSAVEQLMNSGLDGHLQKPISRLILEQFLQDWRTKNLPSQKTEPSPSQPYQTLSVTQ